MRIRTVSLSSCSDWLLLSSNKSACSLSGPSSCFSNSMAWASEGLL
ncbi:Uncharacterised protein [Vibrio cholerae]|nr:Uncharacterised protein [Vibrio cholerae]